MKILDKDIVGMYIAKKGFKINRDISYSDFKEFLSNGSIIKPPYFSNVSNEQSILKISYIFYLDFYAAFKNFDWASVSVCLICTDGSIFLNEQNGEYKFIPSKILHSYQGGSVSGFSICSERLNDPSLINVESDEIDFTDF